MEYDEALFIARTLFEYGLTKIDPEELAVFIMDAKEQFDDGKTEYGDF